MCRVIAKAKQLLLLLSPIIVSSQVASADDWPQWRGPERNGVWNETGIIERFDSERLPLKWRVPISAGYSGPTVADGRVYLTDRVTKPNQIERVLCFDAETGAEIWSYSYDCIYANVSFVAGPRASVTIHDGRAYALGTMGHLHCFDAASGTLLWAKDLNQEYDIRMPPLEALRGSLVRHGPFARLKTKITRDWDDVHGSLSFPRLVQRGRCIRTGEQAIAFRLTVPGSKPRAPNFGAKPRYEVQSAVGVFRRKNHA